MKIIRCAMMMWAVLFVVVTGARGAVDSPAERAEVTSASTAQTAGLERLDLPGRSDDLPYTHVVVAGDTVYLSGGIGIDPETGLAPAEITDEIRFLLDGMRKKLALAGLTMDDLVSVQVFCPDLSLYGRFNDIYRTYFTAGYPARAFVGSGPLLRGGHFEIMGTAVRRP